MAISSFLESHKWELAFYLSVFFVSYKAIVYVHRLYFHPLSKFPGPKICAASRIYEFYWDSICQGRFWARLPDLHRQYGPIIRIGPNELHIHDSQYFDTLFGFRPLNKDTMVARQFGMKYAMWATPDHKTHAKRRAAFGDTFSRSKALKLEDMIGEHIEKACDRIQRAAKAGEALDMAYIYRATPAEIITDYLFNESYGFLEDEQTTKSLYDKRFDVIFGLAHLGRFIDGRIPMVISLLRQLFKKLVGFKEPGSALMSYYFFAQKLVNKVVAEHKNPTAKSLDRRHPTVFQDFLDSSLPESDKQGGALAEQAMAIWSGGWDTTGFTMTAGTYLVLRSPAVLKRLQDELREAWADPSDRPSVATLERLPYLDAVVKESLRMVPGALCRLGRVNPTGPEQYKEWTIPAGTVINMSLPMVSRDPDIWGADPDEFRPERWLGEDADRLKKHLVAFGKGTRACAAEELAWVEIRMLMGSFFRRFDMRIVDEAGVTDDDIMPYYDGFTPASKSFMQRLPVTVTPLA